MRKPIDWLAGLLALVTACGGDPSAPACDTSAECEGGLICVAGHCGACRVNAQCEALLGTGATCVGGRCEPPACPVGSTGCPCGPGDSCATGECIAGTCVDCARGSLGCRCYDNLTCDTGLRCEAGLCAICPPGEEGCPCATGEVCEPGFVCQGLVCVVDPCPAGTRDCPCRTDESCDAGLHCLGNGLCTECSADIVGCPCDATDACTNELVCDATTALCREPLTCLQAGCVAQQRCDEAPGTDALCLPECNAGWWWNTATGACEEIIATCAEGVPGSILADCQAEHRTCVVDPAGPDACGECDAGYTDDGDILTVCRALLGCADCAARNRACTTEHTDTADAVCGACLDGFADDVPPAEACVQVFEPTCTAGDPGDLTASCAALHRLCDDPVDAPASCGACAAGHVETEPPGAACVLPGSCGPEDLDCAGHNRLCAGTPPLEYCGACFDGAEPDPLDPATCVAPPTCAEREAGLLPTLPACGTLGLYCVDGAGGPSCEDSVCPDGSVWGWLTGTCVPCDVTCSAADPGETGRPWPWAIEGSNECLCETEAGFWWDTSSDLARPCDLDADGWVRVEARVALESTGGERQNARCTLRTIDRFVLANEYHQEEVVYLCGGEAPPLTTEPCLVKAPLPLYETKRNDNQPDLVATPAYQQDGVGRRLVARELNSLTRACVNDTADFNDNGLADVGDWQGAAVIPSKQTYTAFSYFVELYEGHYQPGTDSLLGAYVIRERRRTDAATFPIQHHSTGGYWRECTRSRDVAYDGSDGPTYPDHGMDFARWSCADEWGGCPIPPPPTAALPGVDGSIPAHGLSVLAPEEEPADGVWRGMSHHSQFRCVKIDSAGTTPPLPAAGSYAFNLCQIACPSGDTTCSGCAAPDLCGTSLPLDDASNPYSPRIVCAVEGAPPVGSVGFVAFGYLTGAYQRGCIDEWRPTASTLPVTDPVSAEVAAWRRLCPGWITDPAGIAGRGDPASFGALGCGCGLGYGGESCQVGCPGQSVHYDPAFDPLSPPTPRIGWWMCADPAIAGYAPLDPVEGPALVGSGPPDQGTEGQWLLRGDVKAVGSVPLCAPGGDAGVDCSVGFSVR